MRIFASEMGKKKNLSGVFCVILIPFVFSHSILNNSSNPFVSRSNYKSTDTSTKLALNLTVYGCIAACKAEFLHPPATVQSLHTPVHHKLWLYATSKYPLSLGGGKKKKKTPKPWILNSATIPLSIFDKLFNLPATVFAICKMAIRHTSSPLLHCFGGSWVLQPCSDIDEEALPIVFMGILMKEQWDFWPYLMFASHFWKVLGKC